MKITLVEGNNTLNINMTYISSTLSGTVTDAYTGAPIAGVQVTLNGSSTTTNASGKYSFAGLQPGSYDIIFSAPGYESIT